MRMAHVAPVLVILATTAAAIAEGTSDPFAPLRRLEGRWRGRGDGQPGRSSMERSYTFVLGQRFLQVRNTSVYPVQEKNPKGEVHEDLGMFSYDRTRKKLVLRQFHVEGFVNQYVLAQARPDGNELVFVTESIENVPAGFRARETYRFIGADELEEVFELAEPNKEFELYSRANLTRVK